MHCKGAYILGVPQHILVNGAVPALIQDLPLLLLNLPELPAHLFLSWSLWMAARLSGISATPPSSHICVIGKLAEGTLCPIIWNADGDFEQN